MSRGRDIYNELHTRLSTITVANGFRTNVGQTVLRGGRNIDEQMLPCISLIEGSEKRKDQASNLTVDVRRRYMVEAHVVCDQAAPQDAAEDVFEDICQALFSGQPKLGLMFGGLARKVEYVGRHIQPALTGEASTVGVGVMIDIELAVDLVPPAA